MLSKDGEGKCVPEEVRGELERFEREFETGVYREGNRERVLSRGRFRGRQERVHGRDKRGDGGVFQSYGYWYGREEGEGCNPWCTHFALQSLADEI